LPQSIEATRRAIELNPSHPTAYAHVGHGLARMGKPAEGLEYIRYAMRLSPRDPTMAVYLEMAGNAELELGHYEEAIENFHRSTMLKPGYPRGWAGLAAAHALAGHDNEARGDAEKLKSFAPNLSTDLLIEQFGRHKTSRLHQGLIAALGAGSEGDALRSPPSPLRQQDAVARKTDLPITAIAALPFPTCSDASDPMVARSTKLLEQAFATDLPALCAFI